MNLFSTIVVTDVLNTITVHTIKGRHETMINRNCFGLSFCMKGKITYTHNGKEYISDERSAVILPQGESYSIQSDKGGIFHVINFKCDAFFCNKIITLPIINNISFLKDYEEMKSLFLYDGNRIKIMSVFYNILHRLSLYSSDTNAILPAIKYIEGNYQNPHLSNAMLAKECRISEIYLRKLFNKKLKTTPKQFVIDIRIQRAKQLLTEGILKIIVVSELCGFSNPYHF